MYKLLLLIKLVTTDSHTEVVLANEETLRLRHDNPRYEYCFRLLNLALKRKSPIGGIVSDKAELLNVVHSESGIVSDFYTDQPDKLGIGMFPMAGVYYVDKKDPYFERFRSILAESHRDKKRVAIFLNPASPSAIIDVRFVK